MTANQTVGFEGVHGFLSNLFDGDLHAKRVLCLANATLGVGASDVWIIRIVHDDGEAAVLTRQDVGQVVDREPTAPAPLVPPASEG